MLLFFVTQISAQDLINLNPDAKGEPWYVGKLRTLTVEDYKKMAQTPKLTKPKDYRKGSLPVSVDNSLNKYFRPVFNQANGSCGQASGIGYNFTYAINFARDLEANTIATQYPTHYTYNFLNNGTDYGSFYFDGWEIINANGCPDVETYGGTPWAKGLTGWMSGYENYYLGMLNRTLEVFTVDLTTPAGLETLKAWMYDQLNGSSAGGLANFSAGVGGIFSMSRLPAGTPEENKSIITCWGPEINHAMTFVGYNDSIRYDYNGDGDYTNDKDINHDGVVDMRDWEIGGLIMVNSWGTSWGDAGKAYVPYKLLAEPSTNGGIGTGLVYAIRARKSYSPKVTIKASITHSSRNKLRITAGASSDPAATKPDRILQLPLFNYQGGDMYMQGGATEDEKTIEIGLDITPLLSDIESGEAAKFFLVVEEDDPDGLSEGRINYFSVIDYTNGKSEMMCPQSNVLIKNNDTTCLSVNKTIIFDKVQVSSTTLPDVVSGFPYTYALNAQNGTPPYAWNLVIDYTQKDDSAHYLQLTNNKLSPYDNDDGFAPLTLPFKFPFYNKTYSEVLVTTDGSILFGDNFEYVRNISGLMSFRAITVYGSDLMVYPEEGDGIWYFSTKDSITVRWRTSKYDDKPFDTDFSLTLFPSGQINFNYGPSITSSSDWVAGISNGDGISYCNALISGDRMVSDGQQIKFMSSGVPQGMEISKDGVMTFTTSQGNKEWPVTAQVTDLNKISSQKSFTLHSIESLQITPDTINFESSSDPDPWQTGKEINISNVYSQPVTLNNLDWEGEGWKISEDPLTYPYILNPGESLLLNIMLKPAFTKSSGMICDSLEIQTNYVSYTLPVMINPSLFTTSVYPVTFYLSDNDGPVADAVITVDRLTGSFTTNHDGLALLSLPNGNYTYYVSLKDHYPISGGFTISGAGQTVEVSLIPLAVEQHSFDAVTVYPNPFSDELIIKGLDEGSQLCLTGLSGNIIMTKKISGNEGKIDTKNLPCGIYLLKIENSNVPGVVRKVIKK